MNIRQVKRECFSSRHLGSRFGVTLVELLVVIVVTLIFMGGLVEVFAMLGDGMHSGRAIIELNGQVRAATNRLQQDLDGLTVSTVPWAAAAAAPGYLQIVEGVGTDVAGLPGQILGDRDDLLMLTTRSNDTPFVGRLGNTIITSDVAEVIWWSTEDDDGNRNIYRRVLLVRPDLSLSGTEASSEFATLFFNNNDVSFRIGETQLVANSLFDLTIPENRTYRHVPDDPSPPTTKPPAVPLPPLSGDRLGEDVMLGNVAAFDVRVYDPDAIIRDDGNVAVIPGDPGYDDSLPRIASGAFIDLAGTPNSKSYFLGFPYNFASLPAPIRIFDTWSVHYEHDGVNQDNTGVPDQGTNGLDDDGNNGVDDAGERETSPPYPFPLRGLHVKIRVVEPDSRTVRQHTVTADFSP